MAEILLFTLLFILISNISVQAIPIPTDDTEDIMVALARLHQETDRLRRRLSPMPDLITFASNDIADRLERYVRTKQSEEETDTVYVDLKVDSEENLEPKYVTLYVDTKREVNAKYTHLNEASDYINTKVVYLNVNSALNNKPSPSYPRYYRHRQTN